MAADAGRPLRCFSWTIGPARLHFALPMNPRAVHFGAEEVDLRKVRFTAELLACVPAEFARRHRVLPINSLSDKLLVAVADPSDLGTIESLRNLLQRDLELCVAGDWQLDEFVKRFYGEESKP